MQVVRPVFASHPMRFGRGPIRQVHKPSAERASVGSDVRLFAATFLAGFLFVAILIG